MNQTLTDWYVRFLNFLHRPLISKSAGPEYHQLFVDFVAMLREMNSPVLVELGSRGLTGATNRSLFPKAGSFAGFDVYPGEGVDVVGDAHRLADHFEPNSVDAIVSLSVFEHLVYPWKVILEINRVLKPGGLVFIGTHPVWPAHALPWDFWRYPIEGISHLFIRDTGFEIVRAVEGLPCKAYSLVTDEPTREFYRYSLNMGVAVIARKIRDYDQDRLRWDVPVSEVVSSEYPQY